MLLTLTYTILECYLLQLTYLANNFGMESLTIKCLEALKWTYEVTGFEKLQAAIKTNAPNLAVSTMTKPFSRSETPCAIVPNPFRITPSNRYQRRTSKSWWNRT